MTRWIAYPEGEDPNDYIAPEVLLKYAMKACRENHDKLETTRSLNKRLCKEFSQIQERMSRLQKENDNLKQEMIQVRKQARKGRTLQKNLYRLLEKSSMLDKVDENKDGEEFVA